MKIRLSSQVLFSIASLAFTGLAGAAQYKASLLDGLGGQASEARGINNAGQIVGYAMTADGVAHATLWNGSVATALGVTAGAESYASAINAAGQVVGVSYTASYTPYAILWDGTTTTELSTSVGTTGSHADGINNLGQIVGATTRAGGSFATVWNGTTATDLGGIGRGFAINDAGQVAGISYLGGDTYATIWSGESTTTLEKNSRVVAINKFGQVAGNTNDVYYAETGLTSRATVWNGISKLDLNTDEMTGSRAYGINDSGQVVGSFDSESTAFWGNEFAVIWNGTIATNLNTYLDQSLLDAGWVLMQAYDINATGSIVGNAYNRLTGVSRGFLMTASAVPEPQTYALMLAGLAFFAGAVHRRGKLSRADGVGAGKPNPRH